MEDLKLRLQSYENRTRKLERWLFLCMGGWLLTLGFVAAPALVGEAHAQKSASPASLRVSELIVVDPKGVERVRIGGDLPDAVIDGRRIARGQKIAGVLLYDGTGQERGGYVTFEPSGNIGLTLDTQRHQSAAFIAARGGGSFLRLWDGDDSIELRSDSVSSRISAVDGGKVSLQLPRIDRLPARVCSEYRAALPQMTRPSVIGECRARFSAGACQTCLGK